MYAMIYTRPNLAQVVSVVSKYMVNPGQQHWDAVKWILRYLKGTTNVGLSFQRNKDAGVQEGFVDFDYVGDLDGRSTTGYIFVLSG